MKPPKKILFLLLTCMYCTLTLAQTKVSGIVKENTNEPLAYASVYFKNSSEGVITNESGRFELESEINHDTLVVSFIGYANRYIPLKNKNTSNLNIILEEANTLEVMKIYTGKTSKKNNPAIDILRKIWANKRKNGIYKYDQYQFSKYEKLEFESNIKDENDIANIETDSLTENIGTRKFNPLFIIEEASEMYGDNTKNLKKQLIKGQKNTGLENPLYLTSLIDRLYVDYDIYDNYINLFEKKFVSPISTTGIDVYNYVLADSAFIEKKWCYNIYFYPRRKGELTFRGDFWVNDSTWSIKKINLTTTGDVNINWIKNVYVEQEFDVFNDSIFLLTKDQMISLLSLNKKDDEKGLYGKRTTYYKNHKFDIKYPEKFYKSEVNTYNENIMSKDDTFWEHYRFTPLTKEEIDTYKSIEETQKGTSFKAYMSAINILLSKYYLKNNIEYGPVFSTLGYNSIEGARIRLGARTFFGPNDLWRVEAFTAYGFKDTKVKYGLSGRVMLNKENRLILFGGTKNDIEQAGLNLSPVIDALGRNLATNAIFSTGDDTKLTNINSSTIGLEIEPISNLKFSISNNYKTLESASNKFLLDYYTNLETKTTNSQLKQNEINLAVDYTPNRKNYGYGVDRLDANFEFTRIFVNYTVGTKGFLNSDFDYKKLQLYYKQPLNLGGIGRLTPIVEAGKTFGTVPLGIINVLPGNQSYFRIDNAFSQLNYYEFVTDAYVTLFLDHNFEGRLFSRIPYLRELNLREFVGIKGAYGTISQANKNINASNINYLAPTDKVYYEYYFGIGNIFKVLRVDFTWRGNYLENPGAQKFGVKIGVHVLF